MIKQEIISINGKELIKRFSDDNYYIKKVGTNEVYAEAIDLLSSNFNYEETNEKIEELHDLGGEDGEEN